jgi:hypothetical protein
VTLIVLVTDHEGALIAVAINWGDGQSDEVADHGSNVTRSNGYAAAGAYIVTVIALDSGGLERTTSATVTAGE